MAKNHSTHAFGLVFGPDEVLFNTLKAIYGDDMPAFRMDRSGAVPVRNVIRNLRCQHKEVLRIFEEESVIVQPGTPEALIEFWPSLSESVSSQAADS